ncbi:MAG: type IV pilus assembly protein PilM [Candidatus Omnitrophica bacterium]|nr:type IV pilus assembly protein PilM [Candidatus Omnitrophota bacterium]
MTGLLRGSVPSIGLDIGSTSVKGVLLKSAPQGPPLVRFATAPILPGAELPQRAQAVQQVVESLRDGRQVRVVTAVAGPSAVLRSVLLPKMSPQELKGALAFEAEKYIPFKLEEATLDFSIVGDRPEGRMEVLLAAARQELIQSHLALLEAAGVTPYAVDLEALALANAWGKSHPNPGSEGVALIHVGARGTILIFLLGSLLQFTREVSVGGSSFTQVIGESLQLDALQAEAIKCRPETRSAEVQTVLQPLWEKWLTQCRASFDFYEDQSGQRIQRVALSGGSSRLAGFKEWIQEGLGVPMEEWNLLEGFASEVDPAQMEQNRDSLGVAVGLAVRELS